MPRKSDSGVSPAMIPSSLPGHLKTADLLEKHPKACDASLQRPRREQTPHIHSSPQISLCFARGDPVAWRYCLGKAIYALLLRARTHCLGNWCISSSGLRSTKFVPQRNTGLSCSPICQYCAQCAYSELEGAPSDFSARSCVRNCHVHTTVRRRRKHLTVPVLHFVRHT